MQWSRGKTLVEPDNNKSKAREKWQNQEAIDSVPLCPLREFWLVHDLEWYRIKQYFKLVIDYPTCKGEYACQNSQLFEFGHYQYLQKKNWQCVDCGRRRKERRKWMALVQSCGKVGNPGNSWCFLTSNVLNHWCSDGLRLVFEPVHDLSMKRRKVLISHEWNPKL